MLGLGLWSVVVAMAVTTCARCAVSRLRCPATLALNTHTWDQKPRSSRLCGSVKCGSERRASSQGLHKRASSLGFRCRPGRKLRLCLRVLLYSVQCV